MSSSTDKRHRNLPPTETLEELLRRLNIEHWDLLLVGDGSGTGWNDFCGWAVCLVDKPTRQRKLFYGSATTASVNVAEAFPYVHAMAWFDANYGQDRLKSLPSLHVHVVTDSRVTATHGEAASKGPASVSKTNRVLWGGISQLAAAGYVFQWHWLPRNTSGFNYVADAVAGMSRRSLMALPDHDGVDPAAAAVRLAGLAAPGGTPSVALADWPAIYDVNPDAPATSG